MSQISSLLAALAAKGLDQEGLEMVANALERERNVTLTLREKNRQRQQRFRASRRNVTVTLKGSPKVPPIDNITLTPSLPLQNSLSSLSGRDARRKAEGDRIVSLFLEGYDQLALSCGLPRVRAVTDRRRVHVLARARNLTEVLDYPSVEAGFGELFARIRGSPFLTGQQNGSGRHWKADLDWIINESNFLKIMEGRYEKTAPQPSRPNTAASFRFDSN